MRDTGRGGAVSRTASPGAAEPDAAQIDAINQVFALFRLNYHNQFYAAYPDNQQLDQAKRLWLEALANFPPEQLLRGARYALESSEYLPTLNRMLDSCGQALEDMGLPDARSAYREACNAPVPRTAQPWSHPAVYLAGRDAGWHFLSSEPESRTWPAFRRRYQDYCRRAMAGEQLQLPAPDSPPEEYGEPATREEALAALAKIRDLISAS